MRRLLAFATLAMMLGTMLVPAQSASAQNGADLCAAARNGDLIPGYEVVYGRGGSGNQVVLGDDGDNDLRGGSGNDILCGFGGNDILRGNSGNDILVDAETNKGGSGNDTEMVSSAEPENTDCTLAQSYDYPENTPDLADLNLVNCNLSGVDLRVADLTGADLANADLSGAVLRGAILIDADLTGVYMDGAYLFTTVWGNTTCPDGTNSDDDDRDGFTCEGNLIHALASGTRHTATAGMAIGVRTR